MGRRQRKGGKRNLRIRDELVPLSQHQQRKISHQPEGGYEPWPWHFVPWEKVGGTKATTSLRGRKKRAQLSFPSRKLERTREGRTPIFVEAERGEESPSLPGQRGRCSPEADVLERREGPLPPLTERVGEELSILGGKKFSKLSEGEWSPKTRTMTPAQS